MAKKNESQTLVDDFSDEDVVTTALNLWDYDEQKEIFGVVVEIGKGNFSDRQISIRNVEDETIVLPELTTLNSKLKMCKVGDKIKVVYKGEVQSEKNPSRKYRDFDVWIKH